MELPGRTVLITGGASGLGAAAAHLLAREGARVVLVDRDEAQGQALAAELGEVARFVPADVTDAGAMARAVQAAREHFGALHVAVCCAGIGPPRKVVGREGAMPLEAFRQVVEVNLVGTFNALRLAAEAMQANAPDAEGERGVIVTTASVAAWEGQIGQAAYSASKAGIAGLTLPAARELAAYGIRVVGIAPGLFDTPLLAGLPEAARASLGRQTPFPPRLGRPEEFAGLVRHVVGNPMLNGTTLRLDGALRMAPR